MHTSAKKEKENRKGMPYFMVWADGLQNHSGHWHWAMDMLFNKYFYSGCLWNGRCD